MTGFKTLQLQYFFTAGKDEVKAWTIQKGTKAPQAAGRIHTDFEKGFIMAEVLSVSRLNFRKNAGGRGGGKLGLILSLIYSIAPQSTTTLMYCMSASDVYT